MPDDNKNKQETVYFNCHVTFQVLHQVTILNIKQGWLIPAIKSDLVISTEGLLESGCTSCQND